MFFAVAFAGLGGHFDAEGVHVAEEFFGFLGHALFDAVFADGGGGGHEAAGDVA